MIQVANLVCDNTMFVMLLLILLIFLHIQFIAFGRIRHAAYIVPATSAVSTF